MAEECRQEIINRLKSIEGHVRGIERMVENGEYCIDVVNQILAVQQPGEELIVSIRGRLYRITSQ